MISFQNMKIIYLNKNASANQFLWSRIVQAIKRICGISVIFLINLTLLGGFNSLSNAAQEISIKFEGQIMSVKLQGVSLRMILEKLKKEKGIWVKGNESLLDENISVKFEDLSINEGIKRIFANINHAQILDYDNRLVGVVLVGKRGTGGHTSQLSELSNEIYPNPNSSGWGSQFTDQDEISVHNPFIMEKPARFKSNEDKAKKQSTFIENKETEPKDPLFSQDLKAEESVFGETLEDPTKDPFKDPFADPFKSYSTPTKK